MHGRTTVRRLAVWVLAAVAASAAAGPEPPPEAVIADIPFAPETPEGRVMIDLAPEGSRRFVMMLDTGTSTSVLSPRMARSLGVTVRRVKSSPYRRDTRLGRDLQFWIDTRRSDTGVAFEYGLLGADFLDDYVLELDFPGRRVRFLDPDAYEVPKSVEAPDERVVRIRLGGTRVLARVGLGAHRLTALVDTGATIPLLVSGRAAKRAGIDPDALEPAEPLWMVHGPVEVRRHPASEVSFGGFDLGDHPVLVAPQGLYNAGGPTDSVVGVGLMRSFVIRIDYARGRMWLKRTRPPPGSPSG